MLTPFLTLVLIVLFGALALAAEGSPMPDERTTAGYLPPGDESAAGARHIVLIYNGAKHHRDWQTPDFVPLLSYVNRDGRPIAPLFDTFLVLPLTLGTDRAFCPGFGKIPVNAGDVSAYRDDRLFGGDDQLRKLDAAAAQVAKCLHAPALRWKVILTLAYPDPTQTAFGPVGSGGANLDLSRHADRLEAMRWYIRTVRERWTAAAFRHLDMVGWYWVHEASEGEDGKLLPEVAKLVHADGGRFFWIPWFKAPGAGRGADWGFDASIHQPNYFFDFYNGPDTRLNEAAAFARRHGMGVELELDEAVLTRADARAKYRDYLRIGRDEGYRDHALTAWYMGVAALVEAARNPDPEVRAIYDETHAFITGR